MNNISSLERVPSGTKIVQATEAAQTNPDCSEQGMMRIEAHPSWKTFSKLTITLRVNVGLHKFKVKTLLAMEPGQIIESLSPATEDVPLTIGRVQLGWCEFEVLEQHLALRLTRLN